MKSIDNKQTNDVTGKEFRFILRRNGYSQTDLSDYIKKSTSSVGRYVHEPIMRLRLIDNAKAMMGPENFNQALEEYREIKETYSKEKLIKQKRGN